MNEGYIQAQKLITDGTQWLNFSSLNFNGANFEIEFDQKIYTNRNYNNFWGVDTDTTYYESWAGSDGKINFRYGNTNKNLTFTLHRAIVRYTHNSSSNILYVKDVQTLAENTNTFSKATASSDLYLKLLTRGGSYYVGELYGIKITWNGTLLYDLIPAYEEATETYGFYNDIDDTFIVSDGQPFDGRLAEPSTVTVEIDGDGSVSGIPVSAHIEDFVNMTAVPDAGNVFAGWFTENDELISLDRAFSFQLALPVYKFKVKFVPDVPGEVTCFTQKFDLYVNTSLHFDAATSTLIEPDIELTFPLINSAFTALEGATYGNTYNSNVYGMKVTGVTDTTGSEIFEDHIPDYDKLSCLSDRNNIELYYNNHPWTLPFDDNNKYYCLRRKSDGYYFTYFTSMGQYSTAKFYNKDDEELASVGAFMQRGLYIAGTRVHFKSIGFMGYESDTVTENTGIVFTVVGGTVTREVLIQSNSSGNLEVQTDANSKGLFQWLINAEIKLAPDWNPNDPTSNSAPAGGDGSGSFVFDFTPIEELPERISAVSSGFVALYQIPDTATMQDISGYMWSTDFFDNIRKFIEKPEDSVISIHILPVELSGTEVTRETVQAAGLKLFEPGHAGDPAYYIEADRVNNQYYIYDLGFISVPEVWGSQLDYQPYTKAEIYLPYCGMHEIDIDEIAGRVLGLRYAIDLLNGDCMAFIAVDGNLKYQFSGNCLSNIPFSAQSKDYLTSAITLAAGLGTIATGGASVAAAGALLAGGANLLKKDISHGGSISGTRGFLSLQKPVLYLHRPSQNVPVNYKHFNGYPSNITARLGSLNGYTVVDKIHLENVSATMEEKTEIETLLKQGVVI